MVLPRHICFAKAPVAIGRGTRSYFAEAFQTLLSRNRGMQYPWQTLTLIILGSDVAIVVARFRKIVYLLSHECNYE